MVATNLKTKTLSLIDERESMESEMNGIIEILCQTGGPGLSGNLVDPEGFPREDIDIPTVRSQRHRLSELRSNHRDITARIDENLLLLHSVKFPKNASLPPTISDPSASIHEGAYQESSMDVDPVLKIPFAMVDEITDGSPAAEDGLQLGDQIIKLGNVEYTDEVLSKLASEIQTNQGCPIPLVLLRQGSLMNLSITPRSWHGRGLLGCHFRTLR